MLVVKNTVKKFNNGQVTVGANAVQVIEIGARFVKGILLRCPGDNDAVPNTLGVWVGDKNVTTSDGMVILPGESMTVPIEGGEDLYAISTGANQVLAWMAM
jgi:archaellum component FlaF (FlaF/FlaG flagellin family)